MTKYFFHNLTILGGAALTLKIFTKMFLVPYQFYAIS